MMLKRFFRFTLPALMVLLCVGGTVSGREKADAGRRAKARYYYLKGAESDANGEFDAAHEYYKKAYSIDPSYREGAFAYGVSNMNLQEDTFTSFPMLKANLKLMRDYVEAYPYDVEASEKYGYAAAAADTFPEALRVYSRLVKKYPGLSRLYMPLAYYHINNGDIDSAVYAVREFERLKGASTETMVRKVSYWLAKADTVSALAEVRAYVDGDREDSQRIVDQAMVYNILGQQDSAIYILEEAIKNAPDNSTMKVDIAMLYAERGDSVRFHGLMAEAFRGGDLEYEERMGILDLYNKNLNSDSDFSESDKLYEYAATLYPEDADFFDLYADYEVLKADFPAAFEKEKKALANSPKEPSFLGRTITLSIVAQKPEEGIKAFENFPDEEARRQPNILLFYITALQSAENYAKALEWADTLIALRQPGLDLQTTITPEALDTIADNLRFSLSTTYEMAGDSYSRLRKDEDAMRSYENSIALYPENNSTAYNNYAYYLVDKMGVEPGSELFEKAKEMSHKSLEQTEKEPSGNNYDTYAWILYKEGNYEEALTYMELALELEGEDAAGEFFQHYGDILFMSGKPEEALEAWEKGLKSEPDNEILKLRVEKKGIE